MAETVRAEGRDNFEAEEALARLTTMLLMLEMAAWSDAFWAYKAPIGWYFGQLVDLAEIINDWFHKGENPIRECPTALYPVTKASH